MTPFLGIKSYFSWIVYGIISWLLMKALKRTVTFKGTLGAYAHAMIPQISMLLLQLFFSGGVLFIIELMSMNLDPFIAISIYYAFTKLVWLISMIWIAFFFKAAGFSNGKSALMVVLILIIKAGLYLSILVFAGHFFI
jgi:hypothetical protein